MFWSEGQAGLIQILGEDFLPEEQEKSKALGGIKNVFPRSKIRTRTEIQGEDENHPKMWVTDVFPVRDLVRNSVLSFSRGHFAPNSD